MTTYNLNCEVDSPMDKAKKAYRNAIIEECAKVAQNWGTGDGDYIALAIRALKDR